MNIPGIVEFANQQDGYIERGMESVCMVSHIGKQEFGALGLPAIIDRVCV